MKFTLSISAAMLLSATVILSGCALLPSNGATDEPIVPTAKLTGIVQYLFHRSTWTPGNYCYLQDLFVADAARGLGVGRALIEAVYDKAKAAGASRVHWLTHTTNAQARILYDQVAENPGFMQYRKIF